MRDDERFMPAGELPDGFYDRVKAIVDAIETVEGYTVPWVAGRSLDLKRFYPDRDLPREVTAAKVKTRRSVAFHEVGEALWMDEGHTYDKYSDPPGDAHYVGNGVEKINVEEHQGGSWKPYCRAFRPIIKQVDDEALINLPPARDWDRRMYAEDDIALLDRIDAGEAAKSTFTSPDTATSGLQGYDLEGARRRRKKRRTKPAGDPATEQKMDEVLKLFIPITKIDAAKRLVYGVATAEKPDVSGEVCDYVTTKPNYQKWSQGFSDATDGKSLGNLRAMHGNVAAGKVVEIAFNDDAKQIEICGKVVDQAEWEKVEQGVYTGFSQGGRYVKRWEDPTDPKLKRYTADPLEVSLVDSPCLPDATFSVIKVDGSTELRKFKPVEPAKVPSAGDMAAKACELAKAAGDESKWADYIGAATAELTKVAAPAPQVPAAKVETPADNEVGKQVWVNERMLAPLLKAHPELGAVLFDKKNDLRQALTELDADNAAKSQAKPVLEALAGIKDLLVKQTGGDAATAKPGESTAVIKTEPPAGDGKVAKKDYSDDERKDMATKGEARKDGSYPIKTAADVANAVKDWNRSKGSAADKRHIVKRAKAIGKEATDNLPADWPGSTKDKDASKIAGDGALAKAATLWSVSDLIQLLASIESAEEYCESPTWGYGVEVPKDLQARFGAVLVEIGDLAAELLGLVLASTKEEEAGEALAAAALIADLIKLAGDRARLAKAGAKHSKADKARIAQMHDLLVEVDPDCCDAETEDEGAEKLVKTLTAERDADRKAFSKTLDDIMTMVKAIAAQPLPMGTSSVLRVVDKSADTAIVAQADNVLDQPGALEALAEAAIRKAQSRPMRPPHMHGD